MASSTQVLDEARALVERRIAEIDDERKKLERALVELGGKAADTVRRGPGRPRGGARKSRPGKGRRRRSGTRADQAVALIEQNPGISASEIARTMKIKPNYLYRVLGELEKEGRLKKDGRKYSPVAK